MLFCFSLKKKCVAESNNKPRKPPLEVAMAHAQELVRLMATTGLGSCAFASINDLLEHWPIGSTCAWTLWTLCVLREKKGGSDKCLETLPNGWLMYFPLIQTTTPRRLCFLYMTCFLGFKICYHDSDSLRVLTLDGNCVRMKAVQIVFGSVFITNAGFTKCKFFAPWLPMWFKRDLLRDQVTSWVCFC